MRDKELYAQIMRIKNPQQVTEVDLVLDGEDKMIIPTEIGLNKVCLRITEIAGK